MKRVQRNRKCVFCQLEMHPGERLRRPIGSTWMPDAGGGGLAIASVRVCKRHEHATVCLAVSLVPL